MKVTVKDKQKNLEEENRGQEKKKEPAPALNFLTERNQSKPYNFLYS